MTHAEGHVWNLIFPLSFSYKYSFWNSSLHLQILFISQGLNLPSLIKSSFPTSAYIAHWLLWTPMDFTVWHSQSCSWLFTGLSIGCKDCLPNEMVNSFRVGNANTFTYNHREVFLMLYNTQHRVPSMCSEILAFSSPFLGCTWVTFKILSISLFPLPQLVLFLTISFYFYKVGQNIATDIEL